ncbi:MAG: phospholipase D-like domain-containing protein [Parachlamydiaceae bacterium]
MARKTPFRIKKRFISFIVLLLCTFFYSFESHQPAPLAVDGDVPLLYQIPGPDNIRDTLVESIRQANKSVSIVIYALKDRKLIKALNQKAEEGVKVLILCDHEASAGVEELLHKKIKLIPRAAQGLMHQKIVVIDAETIWIGSANFTHDSLTKHFNLVETIKCKEVASRILMQMGNMSHHGKIVGSFPIRFTLKKQASTLHFLPDNGEALGELKKMIGSAKKSVRVAMYTFTRQDLADCLVQAKKRGVDVEVAMDLSTSRNASKKIAALLKKEKIPLHFNSGQELLHHKFVWIDENYLAHGSANWTLAAFQQNDDCIMIHYGLTKDQKNVLQAVWRNLAQKKP